jgi:hypothetical protein
LVKILPIGEKNNFIVIILMLENKKQKQKKKRKKEIRGFLDQKVSPFPWMNVQFPMTYA